MKNNPDFHSPFGTYAPTKAHQLALNILHSGPRLLLRMINNMFMQRRQTAVLDCYATGLKLRFQPGVDLVQQTLLRRRKREKFDLTERHAIENICRRTENPFFIDIGANIGNYSFLLTISIPELQIIAVEPHPILYKNLVFNINTNNLKNIEVLNCAVSDYSGTAKMNFFGPALDWSHIDSDGDAEVNCLTLADIVRNSGVNSVTALKIDVEGYEDRVIIPYLNTMPTKLWPKLIVAEFVNADRWVENPIDALIEGGGYIEVARTQLNSILVKD